MGVLLAVLNPELDSRRDGDGLRGDGGAGRGPVQVCIESDAVAKDDGSSLDRLQVVGGELVVMRIHTGLDEHADIGDVAGDHAGEGANLDSRGENLEPGAGLFGGASTTRDDGGRRGSNREKRGD